MCERGFFFGTKLSRQSRDLITKRFIGENIEFLMTNELVFAN